MRKSWFALVLLIVSNQLVFTAIAHGGNTDGTTSSGNYTNAIIVTIVLLLLLISPIPYFLYIKNQQNS